MERAKLRLFVVDAVEDADGNITHVRLAHGKHAKGIGWAELETEELQKTAGRAILEEAPIYVVTAIDTFGHTLDPECLGFGLDGLLKAAQQETLAEATERWKQSGYSKRTVSPVITELRRVVAGRASDFGSRGIEVPQAEYMRSGLKALRKYDPKRGVRASTFVISSLREAHRPLLQHATPLRVPEARLQHVGKVRRAERELSDELGRPPTSDEVSKRSRISSKEVRLIQKEVKPVHITSQEQVPYADRASKLKEVWALLKPELSGSEKSVYEMLDKSPDLKNTQIARRLGISQSQVSRYRQRLRRKVLEYGND